MPFTDGEGWVFMRESGGSGPCLLAIVAVELRSGSRIHAP